MPVFLAEAIYVAFEAVTFYQSIVIANTLLIVGGLAYSATKARQARDDARNQYNASQVDRLVNLTSAVAPRELVLGRVRKGGSVSFKASTGVDQKDFYLKIDLAGHEVDAIEEIYLNDKLVTVNAGGYVTSAPYTSTTTLTGTSTGYPTDPLATAIYEILDGGTEGGAPTGNYTYQYPDTSSCVKINLHLGAPGQVVDADLHAAFPTDWPSTNVSEGVAYLVAKFTYNETAFPTGLVNVTVVLRGAKLYDPRTATTAWSENPALMMRHIYVHPRFGKAAITANEDARFIVAANACDTSAVYTVGGVAQPARALFKAALVAPFGTPARSLFDDLSQAMGGSWAFAGGELYLKPGVYVAPVMSLTDADLAVVKRTGASESQSPIGISVHKERAQQFNTIKASIWDQAQDYKEVALTPLVAAALVTRDGVPLVQEVKFAAIGYAPQALHVAGIMMRDARDPLVVDLPFKLRVYPLELFDSVTLTLARYGWSAKQFMILGRTWNPDASIQLTLKETSAAITQMDAGFAAQGFASNTNLPSPWLVGAVGPLTVTSGTADMMPQADGTIVSRLRISWPQVVDAAVVQNGQIEVQYRKSDEVGPWTSITVPGNETQALTSEVQDGVIYLVRARAKTSVAVGNWCAQVVATVSGNSTAPAAPTATVTGGMFRVDVTWAFGDTSIYLRGTEVWWSATNARGAAARLSFEPFPATAYSHIGLSAGQGGYYWVRTVDTSGNPSAWYPSSASAGLYGVASADPSALLEQLQDAIGMDQLGADLSAPITLMPGIERAIAIASLQSTLSDWDITQRMQWQETVTNATITTDPVSGQVQILATAVVTTDVEARLNAVEIVANAADATLTSTVATVAAQGGNLSTTQAQVALLAGEVALSASAVYVDSEIAGATGAFTVAAAKAASDLAQAAIQSALDAFTQGNSLVGMVANVATAQSDMRATADALAAQVIMHSALVATVAETGAAILDEASTRSTAVSAVAERTTVLETRVDDPDTGLTTKASITYVDLAESDAKSASAASESVLFASFGTGANRTFRQGVVPTQSSITSTLADATTRTRKYLQNHDLWYDTSTTPERVLAWTTPTPDPDGGSAGWAVTQVNSPTAWATHYASARADAGSAVAIELDSIAARFVGISGTFSSYVTTYAYSKSTVDSAVASLSSAVSAAQSDADTGLVNAANAQYTANVAVTASNANAGAISTLTASVSTAQSTADNGVANAATAQSTANAAASAAGSAASTANTVLARLDTGDYAAVKIESSASASAVSGLLAQVVLQVDVNGHAAGVQLASGEGGSSIGMLADKYLFLLSDGVGGFTTPKQAFILGTVNGVATLGLAGNMVIDGSVVANALAADSVTAEKIKAGEITAAKMATKTITAASGVIDDLAVNTLQLAGNAVTIPMSCSGGSYDATSPWGASSMQTTPSFSSAYQTLDGGYVAVTLFLMASTEGLSSCSPRMKAVLHDWATGTNITIFDHWSSAGSDWTTSMAASGAADVPFSGSWRVEFFFGNNWTSGSWRLTENAHALIMAVKK